VERFDIMLQTLQFHSSDSGCDVSRHLKVSDFDDLETKLIRCKPKIHPQYPPALDFTSSGCTCDSPIETLPPMWERDIEHHADLQDRITSHYLQPYPACKPCHDDHSTCFR
jgi:hypothetical protein